jgi:long-subunit fatty acid transport protein
MIRRAATGATNGHARLRTVWAVFLLATFLLATAASAQIADVPDDEIDFEGFTSLSLGSGARAFGMGGAFLARADDATAASWNPAGLSYLRRPELSIVGARTSFARGAFGQPSDDRLSGYTPDFVAVTYPLQSGSIQVSYQRVFSFRGTREIERPTRTFTTEGRGGFDVIAFGSGWRVGRSLRIGGTVNGWFNGYSQRRLRRAPGLDTELDLDYDLNSGINFNLGAIWSPTDSLNVGVVGKTPFTAILDLRRFRRDTRFENSGTTVTENRAERSDVLLDLPGAVGLGISWRPTSPLTFSADYTRTFWSQGRIRNFFLLNQTPAGSDPPAPLDYRELPYPTLEDPDQTDTEQIRLGMEAVAIAGRVRVPIRAGLFWDRQYFRAGDPTGQPPRFEGFTLGTGVSIGPVLLDVAYVRERGRLVPIEEPVLVRTRFSRVFASIIYRHGQ